MKNRNINIRCFDQFKLWLSGFKTIIPKFCRGNRSKIEKLYDKSEKRIEEVFDFLKLQKDIRTIMTFLEHSLLTDKIKKKIEHTQGYVIDLDESDDHELDVLNESS